MVVGACWVGEDLVGKKEGFLRVWLRHQTTLVLKAPVNITSKLISYSLVDTFTHRTCLFIIDPDWGSNYA